MKLDRADLSLLRALQRNGRATNVELAAQANLMTGAADYLVRIVARDVDDLERIHSTRLTRLAGVARVNSSIAMRQVVRRADLRQVE